MATITNKGAIRNVAMLGNYMPRQCGIATFTTDLTAAIVEEFPDLDCGVLAMNDVGKRYVYPPRVRFQIAEDEPAAFQRAADFLNASRVEVVCVQHEYGIFGGEAGSNVLALLRELRMPIVTTLHTVLANPSPAQREVMAVLGELSERLVVMSAQGARQLREVHGVPEPKIDLIPHGVPSPRHPSLCKTKGELGLEGKTVLLTFGLLSPDKGVEYVIDAMPEILERCPNAVYIVVGATHPQVREHHGEAYRGMLEERARLAGVASSVIFHNRFVTHDELVDFLAAADVYITPYLKEEQSTSGTLAYAVGSGKAVISTPYSYARELLADGRGVLVPSKAPAALAAEVVRLLTDEPARRAMGERAASYGRHMTWPLVTRAYVQCFEKALSARTKTRLLLPTRSQTSAPSFSVTAARTA